MRRINNINGEATKRCLCISHTIYVYINLYIYTYIYMMVVIHNAAAESMYSLAGNLLLRSLKCSQGGSQKKPKTLRERERGLETAETVEDET